MDAQKRVEELIDAAHNVTDEEKEKFKNEFEFMLDSFWKVHKEDLDKKLAEKDIVINSLLDKIKSSDVDIYNKEDIMKIFGVESDKALRILKMAMQMKYASKLGKEFIIKKESLQEFLKEIEGKDLKI